MDEMLILLNARSFSIDSNIRFGEEFARVYAAHEDFVEQINQSIKCQKKYKEEINALIERAKKSPNNYVSLKTEIDKKLNNDERLNHTLKMIEAFKSQQTSACDDYNIKLSDFNVAIANIAKIVHEENLNIVILGKRGAGKSSFINCLFDLNNFEEKAVPTDVDECTKVPSPYNLTAFIAKSTHNKTNSTESPQIIIWDYPGVGTSNFPIKEYKSTLSHMPFDAVIYLYANSCSEMDMEILDVIKDKNVFLVRSRVDEILTDQDREKVDQIDDESYQQMREEIDSMWKKYKQKIMKDTSVSEFLKNHFQESIDKFYGISCLNQYRKYFDFQLLMSDVIEKIPSQKVGSLMAHLQIKSSIMFAVKHKKLLELCPIWALYLVNLKNNNDYLTMMRMIVSKLVEIRVIFGLDESVGDDLIKEFLNLIPFDRDVNMSSLLEENLFELSILSTISRNDIQKLLIDNKEEILLFNNLFKGAVDKCFAESLLYIITCE